MHKLKCRTGETRIDEMPAFLAILIKNLNNPIIIKISNKNRPILLQMNDQKTHIYASLHKHSAGYK